MLWQGQYIGMKFENEGIVDKPAIRVSVYSSSKLSSEFIIGLEPEIIAFSRKDPPILNPPVFA